MILVRDIADEVREVTGNCDQVVMFRAITRAVELLANKGSFDPLLATLDFYVDGAYLVALPRDVKTVLRVNLNNNPSFSRHRIFEYSMNTNGSVDGQDIGWQWHERGFSVIQDETKLPSLLSYQVSSGDTGKTITVTGTDPEGRTVKEVIQGANTDLPVTQNVFAQVTSIVRDATTAEAFLMSDIGPIGQYYPDETVPEYRVIKLSQTGIAVRMLYRKNVFKVTSLDDLIPLHSSMALIMAVDAVRLMQERKYADAAPVLEEAAKIINEEQSSRDEAAALSGSLEVQTVTNTNILTNDVLLVADIYDDAATILGPVGRQNVFDSITDAIEVLEHKAQWDSKIGEADLTRVINADPTNSRWGSGYYVLPRGIEAVLALRTGLQPSMPRNRWFEYHLNGSHHYNWVDCGFYDDKGDVPIINMLPRDGHGIGNVIPVQLLAICENALDLDKRVVVYGVERRSDGSEVEIVRAGNRGYVVPCKTDGYQLNSDAPQIVRVDRISRDSTLGFVRLVGYPTDGSASILLGFWQPDELEPRYRMLRLPNQCSSPIRIRYRKRTSKVSSLSDVINLRSRMAIINMLRAIMLQKTDPVGAQAFEMQAVQYLEEEQNATNPLSGGSLQFEPGTSPGFNANIY